MAAATATVLGTSGLTSFHLDEGPDFAWLNIYRSLADGREGEFAATYLVIAEETAIDGAFSFTAAAPYADFELFIAGYFTPHYSPHFAFRDNRTHPEGLAWYQKPWYGGNEDESWARDDAAEAIFRTEGAVSHRKITRLTSSGYVRETVDAEPDFPHSGDVGLYFYYEIEHFARAVAGEVSPEPDARDAP